MTGKRSLTYGVGINDADYVVQKNEKVDGKKKAVWRCPYYDRWISMLRRCYSAKFHVKQPTYKGCKVCDEWLYFSNFHKWMENQDWEGKQLDKDLLLEGNKIYSPDTCVFVSPRVNIFINDHGRARGKYLIGVSWDKRNKKFRADCCNPFTKKKEYLGLFDTELEAHNAWLERKQEHCIELCKEISDPRIVDALYRKFKLEDSDL